MEKFSKILSQFLSDEIFGERIFSGSSRQFFRVDCDSDTCIVMLDNDTDELVGYARLLKNLSLLNIPVPKVYAVDENVGAMIMEDIGQISLFDWYRSTGDFEPHFRAATTLAKIHKIDNVRGQMHSEFEYWDFIYETQYFLRHFLVGYCGFSENIENALRDEFGLLANLASCSPKGLMHRDYQSQNIFIVPDSVRIVDFQGARYGFRAYDLASLVEDPYVVLPRAIKMRLIEKYLDVSGLSDSEKRRLLEAYPFNAIQRLLQATTAFAYLSKLQGKDWFERFIITALDSVEYFIKLENKFPMLMYFIGEAKYHIGKSIR